MSASDRRTRLRLVPAPPTPQESPVGTPASVFCARCGRAPADGARARVCPSCGLGLVLHAPAGGGPRSSERFVVLGPDARLSAVSLTVQRWLELDEAQLLGRSIIDFLGPASDEPHARADFLASLRAAARGIGPVRRFAGRQTHDRRDRVTLSLRVLPCGPPPGALLIIDDPPA